MPQTNQYPNNDSQARASSLVRPISRRYQLMLASVSLRIRVRERYSVLAVATLILLGGLMPQAGVRSRAAADEILSRRMNSRPDLANAKVRTTSPDH